MISFEVLDPEKKIGVSVRSMWVFVCRCGLMEDKHVGLEYVSFNRFSLCNAEL